LSHQVTKEPEGMVDALVENLFKKSLKGVNRDPAAPIIIKEEPSLSKKVLQRK